MAEDSLKKRYSYKVFVNLAGYAMGLITMGIIPRGLGPKAFGDFNFLTNFFSQIVSFLDMGSSIGFFTKISQRQNEPQLFVFYLWFSALITGIILFFVTVVRAFSLNLKLWPEQSTVFVYCAVFWAVLNWVLNILNQATDAYGLTVSAEIKKLYQKLFSVVFIVILFYAGLINLGSFFVYQYSIQVILIVSFLIVLKQNRKLPQEWVVPLKTITRYTGEFVSYCYPLFVYSLVGLLTGIFDRWILQYFGGSIQQGFYGLGFQIGTICFLFTSAMTPLFIREFSVAYGNKDRERMVFLFRRYIPFLYTITAYFSCFAAVEADILIRIFGGSQYRYALPAVILMSLFPIHTTYGQLSGSVFYATGQTRLYRNIGVPFMIFGSILAYALIAPNEMFGLGMGAVGLAVKMIVMQFLLVNTQLYFNAKFLGISFIRYFGHQIISVLVLGGCALLARFAGSRFFSEVHFIAGFIFSGLFYSIMAVIIGFYFPRVFGLYRDDLKFFMRFFRSHT